MSASLVGSEMCIRDSRRVPTLDLLGFRPNQLRRMDLGKSPLDPRAYAVSYTHLTLPTICSV
eukprot:11749828-Alexandrium_andersonii.AAC.1